jgi:hypothetical protein
LTNARNLYAMLTGRVTAINANSVLQQDGTYKYRGKLYERFQQRELGMFAQDQWRVRPHLTVNAGLRYELQFPFKALDALFATNNIADLCGRAGFGAAASNAPSATLGCQFGVPGVALSGAAPTYKQFTAGAPGYLLDKNNFGPSVGVAWQPAVEHGVLRTILGDPSLATLRASYARAFNQGGTSDYTGTLLNGPGLNVSSNRNVTNANLVLASDAATFGGNGWPLLLRQTDRFGAPPACSASILTGCIPGTPTYPLAVTNFFTTGLRAYDPNYQTSYTDSWSVGIQRAIGKDMSVEVRYIANQAKALNGTIDYNEIDIYNTAFGGSKNFVDEFKTAQKNLAANVAAGCGTAPLPACSFAYKGPGTGTAPLPIFLAAYSGLTGCVTASTCTGATDSTKYNATQWTNNTLTSALSLLSPSIGTFASTNATNGLIGNATFLANGRASGMPDNFWTMNPDVQPNVLQTAQNFTKYHSVQILVNRRLSRGLTFSANYAYQVAFASQLDTLYRTRATLRATNSVPHAFKVTTNYEVPIGRGRRFGSNMNKVLNSLVGDWQLNLTGRVENARLFDIGDVKLVNLTLADLQKEFKYYVNPVDSQVYMLPQDLIANTVKAFSFDATQPNGRPACTGLNPTTCGGPDLTKPYIAPASDVTCTRIIAGDCGVRQQLLKAPLFTRFDLSAKKRFPFARSASFDMELDMLNIFNAIDFNSVFPSIANLSGSDNYRVTSAYSDVNQSYDPGGRIGQLVFRVNW